MHLPQNWHTSSVAEILKVFKTRKNGLKTDEIDERILRYGHNSFPHPHIQLGAFGIFLSQWESPLILLLVIAAVVTLFVGEAVDALVIIGTALINVAVGFIQEYKANRALLKLETFIEEWATVLRSGHAERIAADNVVPGDVVVLEAGDKIPADGRIIEAQELFVDEATLTGESAPVEKNVNTLQQDTPLAERTNMCYQGTYVVRGTGYAIVVATGAHTEFGKIAELLRTTQEDQTPLQYQIKRLGKFLTLMVVVLGVAVFGMGLLRGASFVEMFTIAVAVAIASVPEGLLISMTTILAIGMHRILKRNALVRRLVTTETLGSVSTIATDKTGTLTMGSMRVKEFYAGSFFYDTARPSPLLSSVMGKGRYAVFSLMWQVGLLCNNASLTNPEGPKEDWKFIGDTTEIALLRFLHETRLPLDVWQEGAERLDEIPFSSERKYMATVYKIKDESVLLVKGAPEVLFEHTAHTYKDGRRFSFTQEAKKEWTAKVEEMTGRGLRVIACALKVLPEETKDCSEKEVHGLDFLGVVGIQDPLRPDVKESLALTSRAGIKTLMATGDHPVTALSIARELGLVDAHDNTVYTGKDVEEADIPTLQHMVTKSRVFARVDPRHKLKILEALQKNGEVVAMTGDGVNDAPALKKADIGVAVGSGSTIAKETADLILLDNNFSTIVAAVEQGRAIFENIRKVTMYLLINSFSEVILVVGALVIGMPVPLVAVQILWVNLIVDSFPSIALAFEAGERGIMHEPPRPKTTEILDRRMKMLIYGTGILSDVIMLGIILFLYKSGTGVAELRTITFAALTVNSLLYIYSCRSFRVTIFKKNPFSNAWLNISIVVGFGLLLAAVYVPFLQKLLHTLPLDMVKWGIVLVIGIVHVCLIELVKYVLIIRKPRVQR